VTPGLGLACVASGLDFDLSTFLQKKTKGLICKKVKIGLICHLKVKFGLICKIKKIKWVKSNFENNVK